MALNNDKYNLSADEITRIAVDGIIRIALDDELSVLYANNNFFNILKYSHNDFGGLAAHIYNEDLQAFKDALLALKPDEHFASEIRFVSSQNDIVWIAFSAIATNVRHGGIPTAICNFRNITNIKKYRSELAATYDVIPSGVVHFGIKDKIVIFNANNFYYNMPGNKKYRKNTQLNVIPEDIEFLKSTILTKLPNNNVVNVDYRAAADDDSVYWVNMSVSQIGTHEGVPLYFAILSDVTARHNTILELEKERERYALAMTSSDDIIFEYDYTKDECVFFHLKNSNSYTVKDFSKKILGGNIVAIEDIPKLKAIFEFHNVHDIECRIYDPNTNKMQWFQIQGNIIDNGTVQKFMGTLHNINDFKQKESLLEQKVQIDPLTKAYNRDAAITLIDDYLQNIQPKNTLNSFVCVVDLDNFKKINDTYGHLYGDAVLTMAATSIKNVIGSENIVSRFGGDEFLLFIKNKTLSQMCDIGQDIIQSILELRSDINDVDGISCSVGIAESSAAENPSYNSLFSLADKALYKAKNSGKCKYEFYDANDSYFSDVADIGYTKKFENDDGSAIIPKHEIISLAFEIIDHTDDVKTALRMLLKHIGSTMKLEKIKIMQVERATNEVIIAYAWAREINQPEKSGKRGFYTPEDIQAYVNLFNRSTLVQFNPEVIRNFTPKMQDQLNKLRDRVVFYGAVVNENEDFSMVLYQDDDLSRVWTKSDLSTLQELTKIVSMYLTRSHKIETAENRMTELLNYDELTSLYTLKKFREEAQNKLDQSPDQQFILIYSDFIHFKYLNDLYGFEVGDEILCDFAEFLTSIGNPANNIIARIAGDEFVALVSIGHISDPIERISSINEEYCVLKNEKYPLANLIIRTGIYFLNSGDNAIMAIDRANTARKSLEHLTKCEVSIFDDKMLKRLNFELEMSRSMRSALKNNEFVAFLQPKTDIITNKIIGAEALVRWFRKDGSIVPPNEFIPYFERNGFVTEVDFNIFMQVVKLLSEWLKSGHPVVPISVNLSRVNAREFDLADKIIGIVKDHNVPPKLIEFEITETTFGNIDANFIGIVKQLQDYGFSIDIDDFGSGYSSLNMLSEVPADIIKIDKALLTRSLESPKKAEIIRHIVDMAVAIDYDVICEGVETKEEVDFLKTIGCTKVQGYYFAKPMPIADFDKMLVENLK